MLPIKGGVVSLKDLVLIELYETCGFGQQRGLKIGRARSSDSPFLRLPRVVFSTGTWFSMEGPWTESTPVLESRMRVGVCLAKRCLSYDALGPAVCPFCVT